MISDTGFDRHVAERAGITGCRIHQALCLLTGLVLPPPRQFGMLNELLGAAFLRRTKLNELIQKLVSATGISEEQAQGSVGTVVEFLKGKLPASVHGVLDGAISGEEAAEGGGVLDAAKGALGGVLGGEK